MGSFKTTVMFGGLASRTGELGGGTTMAFVLDIPHTGASIAEYEYPVLMEAACLAKVLLNESRYKAKVEM